MKKEPDGSFLVLNIAQLLVTNLMMPIMSGSAKKIPADQTANFNQNMDFLS